MECNPLVKGVLAHVASKKSLSLKYWTEGTRPRRGGNGRGAAGPRATLRRGFTAEFAEKFERAGEGFLGGWLTATRAKVNRCREILLALLLADGDAEHGGGREGREHV